MALSKAAQEYLTALETERKRQVERGGTEAGERLIKSQKEKARYLAGDDDKQKTTQAARSRLQKRNDKAASMFENKSRAENRMQYGLNNVDSSGKGFSGPPMPNKPAPKKKEEGSSNPRSRQQEFQNGKGDNLFGDFFTRLAKPFRGDGKDKPRNKSNVYEARARAASGGK